MVGVGGRLIYTGLPRVSYRKIKKSYGIIMYMLGVFLAVVVIQMIFGAVDGQEIMIGLPPLIYLSVLIYSRMQRYFIFERSPTPLQKIEKKKKPLQPPKGD